MGELAYDVLGSVWRSAMEIAAPRASESSIPDVVVESSDLAPPPLAPPEAWIAGEIHDSWGYAVFRDQGDVWSYYPSLGAARFSTALDRVDVCATPGTLDPWSVLLAASLPAQRALLGGELCLHASALSIADEVVALVGPSGSGKSTLAAIALERGVRCLSDDAVRVLWRAGRPEVAGVSSTLRLRAAAAERLGKAGPEWLPSVDGRSSRVLPRVPHGAPLTTLAVLRPGCPEFAATELSPARAVTTLISTADRVLHVRASDLVQQRFAHFSQLARTCRVVEVRLPVASSRAALDDSFDRLYRVLWR